MTDNNALAQKLEANRPDDFDGDNAHLIACIDALLDLDDAKALVPNGLGKGSHAYRLLSAARHRIPINTPAPAPVSGDVVERVAKAIYEEDDPWHLVWPWPNLPENQASPEKYREIARAALAAMPPKLEAPAADEDLTSSSWVYEIQYGPEGESNYAHVFASDGRLIAVMKVSDAAKIAAIRAGGKT